MKNYIRFKFIGINTSAALSIDNKIICAVEEERLNRQKRTRKFPVKSIEFGSNKANIKKLETCLL